MSSRGLAPAQQVLGHWLLAVRPRTLGGSAIPVLVGSAVGYAEGVHRASVTVVCLTAAMLMQVGTNLANDALDFARGIDSERRLGPTRVTQAGLLSYRAVLTAASVAFGLATLCGVYLTLLGGIPILVVGLASIAAAVAYSAGPFPLSDLGLGELAAFIFFGLIAVVGTTYLQTGQLSSTAFAAAIPVGALISCLMLVNNLRDIESDAEFGKRTLSVRLGPERSRCLFSVLVALAVLWTGVLLLTAAGAGALLCLASLPLAVLAVKHLRAARSAEQFNRCLAESARLHVVYGLLLALAFVA